MSLSSLFLPREILPNLIYLNPVRSQHSWSGGGGGLQGHCPDAKMLCIYLPASSLYRPSPWGEARVSMVAMLPFTFSVIPFCTRNVVIVLGWHSPREREFYERDPTQFPNQSVQTGGGGQSQVRGGASERLRSHQGNTSVGVPPV